MPGLAENNSELGHRTIRKILEEKNFYSMECVHPQLNAGIETSSPRTGFRASNFGLTKLPIEYANIELNGPCLFYTNNMIYTIDSFLLTFEQSNYWTGHIGTLFGTTERTARLARSTFPTTRIFSKHRQQERCGF